MTGYAMRVPLTNASLIYFAFAASRPMYADDVNAYI
jgi:glyceraldehyde-3-phosphate dehydrogenase/erythrose-4-phosphate dehydrogenase